MRMSSSDLTDVFVPRDSWFLSQWAHLPGQARSQARSGPAVTCGRCRRARRYRRQRPEPRFSVKESQVGSWGGGGESLRVV